MKTLFVIMNKGKILDLVYFSSMDEAMDFLKFKFPEKKFKYQDDDTFICSKRRTKFEIFWIYKYVPDKSMNKFKTENNNLFTQKPYKRVRDRNGHWYWIPKELLKEFDEWNLSDYDSDDFECDKYDEYRTMGDPYLTPKYWK